MGCECNRLIMTATDCPRNRTASEGVQESMSAIGTDKRLGRAFVSIAGATVPIVEKSPLHHLRKNITAE